MYVTANKMNTHLRTSDSVYVDYKYKNEMYIFQRTEKEDEKWVLII